MVCVEGAYTRGLLQSFLAEVISPFIQDFFHGENLKWKYQLCKGT